MSMFNELFSSSTYRMLPQFELLAGVIMLPARLGSKIDKNYQTEGCMKKTIAIFLLGLSFNASASGVVLVDVPDASKLLWQMQADGLLWFRNLNEFSSTFSGCCYNYALNVTTPQGKIFYAMLLTKIGEHKGITLGFTDGALTLMGKHEHFGE